MPQMQYRTLAIESALEGIQNVTPKGVHLYNLFGGGA